MKKIDLKFPAKENLEDINLIDLTKVKTTTTGQVEDDAVGLVTV